MVSSQKCDAYAIAGDLNGLAAGAKAVAESAGYRSAYEAAGDRAMQSKGAVVTAHNDIYHWCGELDFLLYYERSMAPCGVVQIQKEERLVAERSKSHPAASLPNPHWPSDHVSLVADFRITA